MPHPRLSPGHPGEPHADSTVLPGFSATPATDQGRARSFDHPHPGAGGCDSPCAGHARHRGPQPGGEPPPEIAAQGRRAAIRRGRPSRKQRQAPPGQPRQPGARQPGARQPGAQPVHVRDPRPGPAGPGWPPAPREPLTVRPAPPPAPASSQVPSSAHARDEWEPRPPASRCGWSKERARPLVSGGRSGKPGRTVLSACGSPGWPGLARGCGTAGVPGCGPHPARASPLGPLGITRLGP